MMNGIMDDHYPTLHEGFSFTDFLLQIYPELRADPSLEHESILTATALDEQYALYKKTIFFDLSKEQVAIDRALQLPEKNAYALNALVLSQSADGLIVGFLNPLDEEAVHAVQSIANTFIQPVIVKQKDLNRMLRLTYRKTEEIQRYADRIIIQSALAEPYELLDETEDDQISELARLIVRDAFEIEASDIHIETNRLSVSVRLRVDGLLQKYSLANIAVGDHLVRYFKLLADVDITQDQTPSEGKKVAITVGQESMNLRISFMPTFDGQSVVIRILGKADSYALSNKINNLDYLKEIKAYLARSYGMFLISGPTGSGKTTTLYSAIQEINTPDKMVITLEDPVEAAIPGVNQVQVNQNIDYTFAEGIRSALRQDPDVIMIGEIRDEITANMAVRAAITGHLVLSTLHTRGVAEIPIRLLNLKVDPYLLASALRLTVSQRLVRKICPNCKTACTPNSVEKIFLEKHAIKTSDAESFYSGRGCYYCQQTGFSQREAIFEVLHMTPEMIDCLALNAIGEYMTLVKKAMQGRTLLDNAFALATQGVISLSEVMRMESD
ncbi:MAG: GspE/PulE family protein [Pseudomonadota bacterium]